MHSTALTHLDGVAANVGAEVWGRRYIVVRVRRPRGGCSSGGAQPVLSLRPDEAVQHLALISHTPYVHYLLLLLLSARTVAELRLYECILCKNISVQH